MLAHWDDVEWTRIDRGPLQGERQRLGAAAGATRAGLSRYRMRPGERAMPVHVHADEEELFYVLGGIGLSWQDGRTHRVTAGDCICHRAGAEAHTIVAGGEELAVDGPALATERRAEPVPARGASGRTRAPRARVDSAVEHGRDDRRPTGAHAPRRGR